MPTFLDQFLDPGVRPEPGLWTPEQETLEQRERLLQNLVSVRHVTQLKRRLGKDASPQLLSADKKIARMVYNRLLTCFQAWGGTEDDVRVWYSDAINAVHEDGQERSEHHALIIKGAQMDWDKLWEEERDYLKLRVRFMAANAVANDQRKAGNRFANNFVNEYNSIGDVLMPTEVAEREHKFDNI